LRTSKARRKLIPFQNKSDESRKGEANWERRRSREMAEVNWDPFAKLR
jgi:hypothetical protein